LVRSESKLREEELGVRSGLVFRIDGSVFILELLLEGISNFRLSVVSDLIFLDEFLEVAELFHRVSNFHREKKKTHFLLSFQYMFDSYSHTSIACI
jgi:hypothetical protein